MSDVCPNCHYWLDGFGNCAVCQEIMDDLATPEGAQGDA